MTLGRANRQAQGRPTPGARVLLCACLVLAGCEPGPADSAPSEATVRLHWLAVSQVEVRTLPLIYPASGSVVARERVEVASRLTGFIQRVAVEEGETVAAGTVIVEIDDAQVEAAVRGAEAAVASAQADRLDALGDVDRFQTLARNQALAEDGLRKARVRLARAEGEATRSEAELQARRQERRYTRIVSPAPARVRERLRDPGDLVTPGEPILRLDVLGPPEVEVFLPVSRIQTVSVGQTVRVQLEPSVRERPGHVVAIVESLDPVTRRGKVRLALAEAEGLLDGQFARVYFVVGEEPVLVVPDGALAERAGVPGVLAVDAQGTARFRSLQLGRAWPGYHEVLAGVEPGTAVAIDPPASLRDGDRVEARPGPDAR